MRVLVCGGRAYADYSWLDQALRTLKVDVIIHGGARGADTMAGAWALTAGVAVEVYKADWAREGRKAGILRNRKMLAEGKPDLVVAFPGGKGTADMVKRAVEAGVEVWQP